MEKPKFIAFVCNAKIFAIVSFKILLLVRVFGWSNKAYSYVFDLFLFLAHLTNVGFINMLCHVLSCHVFYRKTVMVDQSESMLNLAVQPLKTYIHYPTSTMLTTTKLDRVMTYHEELPPKSSWPFDHLVLQDHRTN